MIRYSLSCELDHTFEGWFRNSSDFESQCARKLVSCPVCGSTDIRKNLMAPAVSTARKKEARTDKPVVPETGDSDKGAEAGAPQTNVEPVQSEQPAALMPVNPKHQEILEGLKTLRQKMIENSDYVGREFAEEARKIHYGESEERNIYGESSKEDVQDLLDEGIAVLPVPILPEEQN